jgi:hypothetical protein
MTTRLYSLFMREPLAKVEGVGIEAAPDWGDLKSPDSNIGYDLAANFASPGGEAWDKPRANVYPSMLKLNHWALSGDWTAKKQFVLLDLPNGRIAYRFRARDLHLIMAPSVPGSSVRFCVRIDGEPPGVAHGADVNGEGEGIVTQQRLYQLIRQPRPIVDCQFEIEFHCCPVKS